VCLIFIPLVVSALPEGTILPPSNDLLAQESPELIGVLKTHAAYVGEMQQARMDGVIAYINRISGGAGTTNLEWIQEDYLTAAASIPLMYSSDEITAARGEMRLQSVRFLDETKAQMLMFNGSEEELRASINTSVHLAEDAFESVKRSSWLARGTARLSEFNTSTEKRASLLLALTRQGIDITRASSISEQIGAKRTELETALVKNRNGAIQAVNTGLAELNHRFRDCIEESRTNHQIQMKAAAIQAVT
jgi:hypothetical protein